MNEIELKSCSTKRVREIWTGEGIEADSRRACDENAQKHLSGCTGSRIL